MLTMNEPVKKKKKTIYYVNVTRIARGTGYSVAHMSRVFRNESGVSIKCVEKVSAAMGISVEELLSAIRERRVRVESKVGD